MVERFLVIAAALVCGSFFIGQSPCEAGWCPSHKCYGSGTCVNCVCMSSDPLGGARVDISHVPSYEARGWVVLP